MSSSSKFWSLNNTSIYQQQRTIWDVHHCHHTTSHHNLLQKRPDICLLLLLLSLYNHFWVINLVVSLFHLEFVIFLKFRLYWKVTFFKKVWRINRRSRGIWNLNIILRLDKIFSFDLTVVQKVCISEKEVLFFTSPVIPVLRQDFICELFYTRDSIFECQVFLHYHWVTTKTCTCTSLGGISWRSNFNLVTIVTIEKRWIFCHPKDLECKIMVSLTMMPLKLASEVTGKGHIDDLDLWPWGCEMNFYVPFHSMSMYCSRHCMHSANLPLY